MNLYEIATHYRQLIEMLSGDDEIPQEQIDDMLAANNDALNIKVANVIAVIKTMSAEAAAHRDIANGHLAKAEKLEKAADRLKDGWLLACLQVAGVNEAGTIEHSCKLPKPRASLDIVDTAIVPDQFWRVIPQRNEIDKVAAKKALESGEKVEGCSLKYKQTVRIS
jgi:hypothetical protein